MSSPNAYSQNVTCPRRLQADIGELFPGFVAPPRPAKSGPNTTSACSWTRVLGFVATVDKRLFGMNAPLLAETTALSSTSELFSQTFPGHGAISRRL
jgi:hypothetical protein